MAGDRREILAGDSKEILVGEVLAVKKYWRDIVKNIGAWETLNLVVLRKSTKFNTPPQYVPPYGIPIQGGEGEYVHAYAVVQANRDRPYCIPHWKLTWPC